MRSLSAPGKRPRPCFLCYPKQAAFLSAPEPIRGFVAGQGAGKSKVGSYDLLQRVRDGRTYMVTGPTYKVLGQATIRTFVETAREFDRLVRVTRSTDNPSALVRLAPPRRGLAEILFRSTENPDHLRGPNLSGVWMDEASLSSLDAYQILTMRLRERGKLGWLSATFTPRGLGHWTFEVFGQQPPRPGVFLVHARTDENPFLPPEYLTLVQSTYQGVRAEQELGGRFVSIEGAEWPPDYFHDALSFSDWPAADGSGWVATAMALDPSKGRDASRPKEGKQPDYSAYVWGGADRRGVVWVDADLDNVRDTTRIVADGIRHYREWPVSAWVTEVNGFQSLIGPEIARQARDLRLPSLPLWGVVHGPADDKMTRIRATVGPYLAKRELRFKDSSGCRLLVAQLRDFPFGQYDDGPDSLAMMLRMLKHLVVGEKGPSGPRLLRA